jgi:hypothetical protein
VRRTRACMICGFPTGSTRRPFCKVCRRERDRALQRARDARRPSSTARGYDRAHKKLRARVARDVEAGVAICARCLKAIVPGTPWDLGHHDLDRTVHTGPEHASCNRATAARRAARPSRSRAW